MKIFIFVAIFFHSLFAFAVPTTLTANVLSETPLEATYSNADAVNGNRVLNPNGDVAFHFKNPGGTTATVTVEVQKPSVTVNGLGVLTKTDITCNLLTTEECFIGPLNTRIWNDTSGFVQITYGGAGSGNVDVIAFRAPKP